MRKCAIIWSYMRRPLVIYDFATAPFWLSLYMTKNLFSFLSVFISTRGQIPLRDWQIMYICKKLETFSFWNMYSAVDSQLESTYYLLQYIFNNTARRNQRHVNYFFDQLYVSKRVPRDIRRRFLTQSKSVQYSVQGKCTKCAKFSLTIKSLQTYKKLFWIKRTIKQTEVI